MTKQGKQNVEMHNINFGQPPCDDEQFNPSHQQQKQQQANVYETPFVSSVQATNFVTLGESPPSLPSRFPNDVQGEENFKFSPFYRSYHHLRCRDSKYVHQWYLSGYHYNRETKKMIPYHEDAQPLRCYNDDKFASCLAYGMLFVVFGIPFLLYLTSVILNWGGIFHGTCKLDITCSRHYSGASLLWVPGKF